MITPRTQIVATYVNPYHNIVNTRALQRYIIINYNIELSYIHNKGWVNISIIIIYIVQ